MKNFRQFLEQHREEGRFKPVKPHNVSNIAAGSPRGSSDSANVKLKEEQEDHFENGYKHAMDHALDSGNRETARSRKTEMLSNNPHKKGTPEHKEWHKGAVQGHSDGIREL